MNKKTRSNLALLTAAVVWGFAFVTQCMVDTKILGEFSFNGIRYALGGFCLFPVIYVFENEKRDFRKFKKTIIFGAITGVILFIASAIQMYGIAITKSAGRSGFLTGLYMVIVPFYSSILFHKKVRIQEWLAAIIAIIGLYFLSVKGGMGRISYGDMVLLIGALFWAAHIIAVDKFVDKVSPIKYSCVQFFTCSLCNLVFAAFLENITPGAVAMHWLPILYTGVFSTGVAYTCQVIGQKDANPNSACILLSLEGLFSAIGGAIFMEEIMDARSYFGCALMFFGAILSQINFSKEK